MVKTPVSIGPHRFETKGEAGAFLKAMLHRYDIGDRVSSEDANVLLAALALHPDASTKVGCGVSYFSVRSADFGTKCFWVNRVDGTSEKFSYKACIRG